MPLDSELRGFEVDPDEPFARITRRDGASDWVVFFAAFGLFVLGIAALWAVVSSKIFEPIDTRSIRIGSIAFVVVSIAFIVLFKRGRANRIQRMLREGGLPPAQAIFAIRPRWGRNMRLGSALAFLPGQIVIVHGASAHPVTRIEHRSVSSIQHLDRAGLNHVAIHIDRAAYLFTLWPSVLLPQPPFGSHFVPPRAASRARGSLVLREAILESGIPFKAERIR